MPGCRSPRTWASFDLKRCLGVSGSDHHSWVQDYSWRQSRRGEGKGGRREEERTGERMDKTGGERVMTEGLL